MGTPFFKNWEGGGSVAACSLKGGGGEVGEWAPGTGGLRLSGGRAGALGLLLPPPTLNRCEGKIGGLRVHLVCEKTLATVRGHKRGGEKRFSANDRRSWQKIRRGFFKDCGCNGDGACL